MKKETLGDFVVMRSKRGLLFIAIAVVVAGVSPGRADGQIPVDSEIRQIVTFSFLPGRMSDALAAYRSEAIPLYEENAAMLSFRGFREVESPIPLSLMIVSAFDGMAGMDASNAALRDLAVTAGTTIGALYGAIGALSTQHTDQFVEMLPRLGNGDASSRRLTAFVWYRIESGEADAWEGSLARDVVPWEEREGVPSSTGRFLVSDGWHYLRMLGFDTLGEYQDYWAGAREVVGHRNMVRLTSERREVIVASMSDFAVR